MSTRRDLLRTLALSSSALLLSRVGFSADAKKKDEKAPAAGASNLPKMTKADMVPEDSGTADGLDYCENVEKDAKSKKPRCPARRDSAKKGQYCNSPCHFYTPAGVVDGGEVGKCILIQDPPNKYVAAKGWCNSWAAKMG